MEGVIGARVAQNWVYFYPVKPATVGEVEPSPLLMNYDRRTEFIGGQPAVRSRTAAIVIGQRLDDERVYATRVVMSPR